MIVFSDRARTEDPRALVAALRARIAACQDRPSPDALLACLIEAGALEAAIADALQPEVDDAPCLAASLASMTLDLARAQRAPDPARLGSAASWLGLVAVSDLPPTVALPVPEGFAFYALDPAMTRKAARRFLRAVRPDRVAVLGLRTIGATLAAVAAAEIEADGVPVEAATARPRGHPWDRELRLGPRLARWLEGAAAGHVLIVDEGPGLSGTSFAAAAEAASRAGTPNDRIHLLPSWDANGSGFRSDRARAAWARHRRWTASFEETVLPRLALRWDGTLRDLSGGLWRDLLPPDAPRPPVQPQHERRKYLVERPGGPPVLLKFAGLGPRGEAALSAATAQAEAGIGPPVLSLRDGFLAYRWLAGRPCEPLRPGEAASPELLDAIAARTSLVAASDPTGPVRFDDLLAMTRLNVAEALGPEAAERTAWMEGLRAAAEARPARAVDGRMLPHEWLRLDGLDGALVKCDGVDHHDDHFWPGCQDVAWDLAGAMIEWRLSPDDRERLLALHEAAAARRGHPDPGARALLPLNEAAYLAWRLGYATLAAETLGDTDDGLAMAAERDRYAALLAAALDRGGLA